MCILLLVLIILYVWFDVNYVIRTGFTVLSGRVYQRKYSLNEVTTIYGVCTLLDCDIFFRHIRLARLVREIDFARYHFYDRTRIYQRSRKLKIRSLQGCTLTDCNEPIPLFSVYKIDTKLVYWDKRSLFFDHKVTTLRDNKVRYSLTSRQFALRENGGNSTEDLLRDLPSFNSKPKCPDNIKFWMESIMASSIKLRQD